MTILFTDIEYLSESFTIERGFVLVEGATIAYVGGDDPRAAEHDDPRAAEPASSSQGAATSSTSNTPATPSTSWEVIDGKGRLLIPGLYNTHTHIPMALLRGYAEGLPLAEWLHTKVFPFEALITPKAALHASELAIAEMLRFGTVGFTDMYNFTDERAEAVTRSGIKANLSYGVASFDPEERYEDMAQPVQLENFIKTYHNTAEGRLKIDLFVHSEYLSNPYIVQAAGEHACELGVQTHIHLSETREEHEECKARRAGLTPTQYFDSLGFFAQPCTAAHCVWTEPQDWTILAERGVTAAHNPCSNAKLGSGFMPLVAMQAAGVNVALGTDSVASNNNLNLLKEIYTAALLPKATQLDAALMPPAEVLALAMVNGARSQGRSGGGLIKLGAPADLVLLDTEVAWVQPVHNLLNNLVYSAQGSDVVLTMVDGKVLYTAGEWTTVDVERAAFETGKAAQEIVATL
jgi:5-methylthioadenosine/S-adenosylhomocysteine deaminase